MGSPNSLESDSLISKSFLTPSRAKSDEIDWSLSFLDEDDWTKTLTPLLPFLAGVLDLDSLSSLGPFPTLLDWDFFFFYLEEPGESFFSEDSDLSSEICFSVM